MCTFAAVVRLIASRGMGARGAEVVSAARWPDIPAADVVFGPASAGACTSLGCVTAGMRVVVVCFGRLLVPAQQQDMANQSLRFHA